MFAMATFAVGCNNSDKDATAMLEILPVDTTASSITFVINVEADECAYMLYDGENISVDTVLSEGTATDGGVITIKDLQPKTKYYVVAAARSGKSIVMKPLMMETKEGSNNNGDNNDDNFELPEIEGVENIVIEKTKDGRWYEVYNYYVTFVRDNGDRIILDF